jgi:hypothetical protein
LTATACATFVCLDDGLGFGVTAATASGAAANVGAGNALNKGLREVEGRGDDALDCTKQACLDDGRRKSSTVCFGGVLERFL